METVVVGMSGGVDSSTAAILLKEQGYNVIGLFMRNWDSSINGDILGNPDLNDNICPQEQDYNDALKVCKELEIPLHRVDFTKEYWDYVFTYFLDELKLGRTPNPDVMCNKYIKFDKFKIEAKRLGADYIATGHYARIKDGKLLRGLDNNKDQSYFLSQLSSEQLTNVLFPIGDFEKDKVRSIAAKYNLITADKKDSTGICFIGERDFSAFLTNYLPNQPGDMIDIESNRKLASHIGLMHYTIGQRRGLNVGGTDAPLYVVGKDLSKNVLYVSTNQDYLVSDSCVIDTINMIVPLSDDTKNLTAKFRYRQKDISVEIKIVDDGNIIVKYSDVKSVTPGQVCVLYDGEVCVGSGIIKQVFKDNKELWYLK